LGRLARPRKHRANSAFGRGRAGGQAHPTRSLAASVSFVTPCEPRALEQAALPRRRTLLILAGCHVRGQGFILDHPLKRLQGKPRWAEQLWRYLTRRHKRRRPRRSRLADFVKRHGGQYPLCADVSLASPAKDAKVLTSPSRCKPRCARIQAFPMRILKLLARTYRLFSVALAPLPRVSLLAVSDA
jgi:hypothetical protein